jgi:hypothetical protein
MVTKHSKTKLVLSIGASLLVVGSVVAYAGIVTIQGEGDSDQIGLWGGSATLTARKLVTPVGETTGGWHYHPGYVYNVVAEGTITVEDGCGEVVEYSEGEAFEKTDGRVHRAYNLGDVDAVEYSMFINRPGTMLGKPVPKRCGPPSIVDECKNGGWQKFDHPGTFESQGECVAYVNNRPTITLLVPEDPPF